MAQVASVPTVEAVPTFVAVAIIEVRSQVFAQLAQFVAASTVIVLESFAFIVVVTEVTIVVSIAIALEVFTIVELFIIQLH